MPLLLLPAAPLTPPSESGVSLDAEVSGRFLPVLMLMMLLPLLPEEAALEAAAVAGTALGGKLSEELALP